MRLVKAYDYTDADGKLIFQVCRYDPKTFKQRRPNGNGGLDDLAFKDVPRFLYRLPAVIKADEVLIVEGEKDCDTARGMGFTATTSPMGAKKWRDEYTPCLQGKAVVLIPDNDNEGEHMAQVGAAIRDTVKSLKWLELPDVPSKGDLSDWAKNFPSKEEAAERLAIPDRECSGIPSPEKIHP